jgi:hypothetical protein
MSSLVTIANGFLFVAPSRIETRGVMPDVYVNLAYRVWVVLFKIAPLAIRAPIRRTKPGKNSLLRTPRLVNFLKKILLYRERPQYFD